MTTAMTVGAAVRRLQGYGLFYLGVILFGISCLIWSLTAGVLYRLIPAGCGTRLGQRAIMTGFRAYVATMEALGLFRCDLRALDALAEAGPLIIAPNHPSLLDAVLVISRLPRVVCITKASLWDNVFLGGSVRLAAYIRNDAPVKLVRAAMAQLRDGQQLLIFPEGTRTVRPPVNSFKGGFLLMARKAGVPVQTVFLESNTGYLSKGWPLFRKPALPLLLRARLGRRFEVPADLQSFTAELEQYFREELAGSAAGARQTS